MLRRCPTPLTILVAALAFGLGLWPSLTEAASSSSSSSNVSTYSFITTAPFSAPSAAQFSSFTDPQIQFLVEPYGSLVYSPPTSTSPGTSPLAGPITVTPALDSSNQAKVGVLTTNLNGQQVELLGFSFSNGLPNVGSILQVPLYYNTSQPPQIIPETSGISPYTPSSGSTADSLSSQSSGGGVTAASAQTPEPLSLLIWAVLAGVLLARARFPRRLREVAVEG